MVFSNEDRILIEQLYLFKAYGARKLVKEFPEKKWHVRSVSRLLKKLKETGTTSRKVGSGRPRTSRTQENINAVGELVLSQEDAPGTHKTVRQIARQTRVHRSSIVRIVHQDLQLKCVKKKRAQLLTEANRLSRVQCSQQLLDKFSEHEIGFIFFSDEKVFTVAPPMNSQNDRVYAPMTTKKREINAGRLLRVRPTFSKSVMVSVAVSKLGCTKLVFVEPGVKINGHYYTVRINGLDNGSKKVFRQCSKTLPSIGILEYHPTWYYHNTISNGSQKVPKIRKGSTHYPYKVTDKVQ